MIKKLKTHEDSFYLEMLKRFGRLMVRNDAFFSTLSKEVL